MATAKAAKSGNKRVPQWQNELAEAFFACMRMPRYEFLQYLLSKSPPGPLRGADGYAMHVAAQYNDIESMQALMSVREIDIDFAPGDTAESPLFFAVRHNAKEAVEFLLHYGAQVNTQNARHQTVLHIAGNQDIIDLLLEAGADINHQDDDGETPVFLNASTGRVDATRVLLERGADPRIRNKAGLSAMACVLASSDEICNLELINLLLQHRASSNILAEFPSEGLFSRFRSAFVPSIFLAVEKRYLRVVLYLLTANDAFIKYGYGFPFATGIPFVESIFDSSGDTLLCRAAAVDAVEVMMVLIDAGANINLVPSSTGKPALHVAVEKNAGVAFTFLLESKADVNIRHVRSSLKSPLHLAAVACNLDFVSGLLKHGADPNIKDARGCTPLAAALCSAKGSDKVNDVIKCLLSYGAKSDLVDIFGTDVPVDNIAAKYLNTILTHRRRHCKRAREDGEEKATTVSCIICMNRPIACVFVPCGHRVVCNECSVTYKGKGRCPMCRTDIQWMVPKVFDA